MNRIYKKYGFLPRRASPVSFAKASLLHHTQKISWRAISRQVSVDHSSLYRFDEFAREHSMHREIFHVFLESKSALYIGKNRVIDMQTLDNSQQIYDLTKAELESILERI